MWNFFPFNSSVTYLQLKKKSPDMQSKDIDLWQLIKQVLLSSTEKKTGNTTVYSGIRSLQDHILRKE